MRRRPVLAMVLPLLLAAACTGGHVDGPGEPWSPAVGTAWQWQLGGLPIDTSIDVPVYDVDLFETTDAELAQLHGDGRHVICYVSVGSWEPGRPDSDDFPAAVIGKALEGWPDEHWLDIRQLDVVVPIMRARIDRCAERGFDAVEADNVEGYANDSGFELTADDQLAFIRALADVAHGDGLSFGLKNDLEQIPALVDDVDWALNEECVQYEECDAYGPFIDAGKAVLHVEYEVPLADACAVTDRLGAFSTMIKDLALTAPRRPCPPS